MSTVPEHVDETGAPCARHAAISPSSLYQLAMVGSRAPAFHHDCASKLQGLVMALDELTELTEHGDPQLIRAVETALEASRELNALLNLNRALTRAVPKTIITVSDLVTRAAERSGVGVRPPLDDTTPVNVGVAAMVHGLALAIDIAAGTGRGRALAVTVRQADGQVDLVFQASPMQPSNAGDLLAIAGFIVGRDGGGKLWCSAAGDQIVIRLPAA